MAAYLYSGNRGAGLKVASVSCRLLACSETALSQSAHDPVPPKLVPARFCVLIGSSRSTLPNSVPFWRWPLEPLQHVSQVT